MLYYQIIILLTLLATRLSAEVIQSYIHTKRIRLVIGSLLLIWLFIVLTELVNVHILKV